MNVNYGIRFPANYCLDGFTDQLSAELVNRLTNRSSRCLRLKLTLLIRQPGTPLPKKFGACGPCYFVHHSLTLGMRTRAYDRIKCGLQTCLNMLMSTGGVTVLNSNPSSTNKGYWVPKKVIGSGKAPLKTDDLRGFSIVLEGVRTDIQNKRVLLPPKRKAQTPKAKLKKAVTTLSDSFQLIYVYKTRPNSIVRIRDGSIHIPSLIAINNRSIVYTKQSGTIKLTKSKMQLLLTSKPDCLSFLKNVPFSSYEFFFIHHCRYVKRSGMNWLRKVLPDGVYLTPPSELSSVTWTPLVTDSVSSSIRHSILSLRTKINETVNAYAFLKEQNEEGDSDNIVLEKTFESNALLSILSERSSAGDNIYQVKNVYRGFKFLLSLSSDLIKTFNLENELIQAKRGTYIALLNALATGMKVTKLELLIIAIMFQADSSIEIFKCLIKTEFSILGNPLFMVLSILGWVTLNYRSINEIHQLIMDHRYLRKIAGEEMVNWGDLLMDFEKTQHTDDIETDEDDDVLRGYSANSSISDEAVQEDEESEYSTKINLSPSIDEDVPLTVPIQINNNNTNRVLSKTQSFSKNLGYQQSDFSIWKKEFFRRCDIVEGYCDREIESLYIRLFKRLNLHFNFSENDILYSENDDNIVNDHKYAIARFASLFF